MKIIFSSDQDKTTFNKVVFDYFKKKNLDVIDVSLQELDEINYIIEGVKVGEHVTFESDCLGIIISDMPLGAVIAANKVTGIRCVGIFNDEMAKISKIEFNPNVIVLSSENIDNIIKYIDIFMSNEYDNKKYDHEITTLIDYEVSCLDC